MSDEPRPSEPPLDLARDLDSRSEALAILEMVAGDGHKAYQVVQSQFQTLVLRTQVLLGLSGVLFSATAIGGRFIATAGLLATGLAVAGLAVVLGAAATCILGVLRLRWLTDYLGGEASAWLPRLIELRERKRHFLARAQLLFLAGAGLYAVAVSILLLRLSLTGGQTP